MSQSILDTLTREDGLFQHFTSLMFILAGTAGFGVIRFPTFLRWLLLISGSWLAMDETMMFHECLKITLFRGWHSFRMEDTTIVIYAVLSVLVLGGITRYVQWNRKSLGALVLCAFAASIVVLHDVLGFLTFQTGDAVEEVAEMLLAALVTVLFRTQSNNERSFLRDMGLSLGIFALFCASFHLIRPNVCIRLYDTFHP